MYTPTPFEDTTTNTLRYKNPEAYFDEESNHEFDNIDPDGTCTRYDAMVNSCSTLALILTLSPRISQMTKCE
jgi:hypothetical protein